MGISFDLTKHATVAESEVGGLGSSESTLVKNGVLWIYSSECRWIGAQFLFHHYCVGKQN